MPALRLFLALMLLAGAWAMPARAEVRTVDLPLTLDTAFIQGVFQEQAYTAPGGRALVADRDQGCTRIELWDLRVAAREGLLILTNRIRVRAGVSFWGRCFKPLDWEGQITVRQRVWVDPGSLRMRVAAVGSEVFDRQGRPATVADTVWRLIQEDVHAYLDQFTINLNPPKEDLGVQLPLLFAAGWRERVKEWVATLRPVSTTVESGAVKVVMQMDVDLPPAQPRPAPISPVPPSPPTPEEVAAFSRYWESWDAFLVEKIKALSGDKLSPEERERLADVLLDARYGFLRALEENNLSHDLVRRQFLASWTELAPLLRKHLMARHQGSLFDYLAFLTAGDALAVLDKLGPALNLEISRQGLIRLARLLDRSGRYPELEYSYAPDPELRKLLGLGPALPAPGPALSVDSLPLTPADQDPPVRDDGAKGPRSGLGWRLLGWLAPSPAGAAETRPGDIQTVRGWLPGKDKTAYLARVRGLVREAGRSALDGGGIPLDHHQTYHRLLEALVWQESCWRQFVVRDDKIVYLLSYNGSSVGLMQVNYRVWRGVYAPESLRWDIAYNARAGAEITALYLKRHALERLEEKDKLSPELLARAVYAMYNGGPGQLRPFLKRHARGRLFLSDRLFLRKLQLVTSGKLDQADSCLR